MLKVKSELLDNREAKLTIEVAPERVDRSLKKGARRLARKANIPGFRKGKAPYHVIVTQFGEGAVYDEILDELGQEVYSEALEESKLEPYGPGTLENMELDPMVLVFNIPLLPEIDLGEYRKTRIKRKKVKVEKQEVKNALEALRAEQAVLEPVERPLEFDDVASFEIKSTVAPDSSDDGDENQEPQPFIQTEGTPILIAEDTPYPLEGFGAKVVGMQAGEERNFALTISEDDGYEENMVGREVQFEVKCLDVKRRELPDLDNEFAKSVGDYENLKALKSQLKNDLLEHKQHHADEEYAEEAKEAIMDKTTLIYPPSMLEDWLDKRLQTFEQTLTREQNLTLEDYLSISGGNNEQLREEFRDDAESSLRHALLLGKLIEEENVTVEDDAIADQIETLLLTVGSSENVGISRHLLDTPAVRSEIRQSLLIDKVRELLVAIASGNAPPLAAKEKAQDLDEEAPEEQND